MTLPELMIALIVFGVIVTAALSAMLSQSRGFRLGSEQMDALQNLRFTANVLELDLRTAGSNVPDNQPFLIFIDEDVIAFNADYATNVANDAWAVYYDPDAPTGSVTALTTATPITIPHSASVYPAVSYQAIGGVGNSPAETIVFFFDRDSSTARNDDFALFKQVNQDSPELVGRNLLQTAGQPFFGYFRERTPPSAPTRIEPVATAQLPWFHSVPLHGSAADTGTASRIDSVRAVQVNFTTTNGRTGADERLRSIARLVWLPNAGLQVRRSCGDEPILGTNLAAAGGTLPGGAPVVTLSWGQAVDEAAGENDVARYVIWRRLVAQPDWGDPLLSIPAGQVTYTYEDQDVASGDQYYYALAAQDCTPSLSPMVQSSLVTVP
jgi:prepilin-type N-terminal cleavage/methylation domain-containing protein